MTGWLASHGQNALRPRRSVFVVFTLCLSFALALQDGFSVADACIKISEELLIQAESEYDMFVI